VAAKLTNYLVAQEAVEILERAGLEIAHTWMLDYDPDKPDPLDKAIETCKEELIALEQSTGLLFILPGGRGAHVELGYAFAKDIPTVFYSTIENPEMIGFYGHRKVHSDLKDAVIDLLGQMLKDWKDD
jgi:nucleoside 2-deoxyribosyltransferase